VPRGAFDSAPQAAGLRRVLSFTPAAQGILLQGKRKPRGAELKKANVGPKGRTLAHGRATSRRSR